MNQPGSFPPPPPPMAPPPGPEGPVSYAPHRGGLILAFGILGIAFCFIFGILAWSMGGGDLREMAAGRMDPEGRGLTEAGRILGIVSVVLSIGALVVGLFVLFSTAVFAGH